MHSAATPLPGTDRKVDRLLAHYGESHQNPTNEAIHMIAIPAIMLSIVGLLYALHPWVAYASWPPARSTTCCCAPRAS